MSFSYPLSEIDDAKLAYYYTSQSTEYGIYYRLKTPEEGYPEGFYASERDEEMRSYNQQMQMAESSGNRAKQDRGKRVDDDTTLPSDRIANAERIEDVTSSGDRARKKRGRGKKKDDSGAQDEPWSEWAWQPEYNRYYRSRQWGSGEWEYDYDYSTPGPAF